MDLIKLLIFTLFLLLFRRQGIVDFGNLIEDQVLGDKAVGVDEVCKGFGDGGLAVFAVNVSH